MRKERLPVSEPPSLAGCQQTQRLVNTHNVSQQDKAVTFCYISIVMNNNDDKNRYNINSSLGFVTVKVS